MTQRRLKQTRKKKLAWATCNREALLETRLCDLDVEIAGTVVERRLDQLHREFANKGVRFKPYAWLSTDWFTPDGTTGFAVPFYLAHPRLKRLEHREMLAVEGGTQEECMKLFRHEAAHAIDNAYRLRRMKRWREVFGPASTPYRQTYRPRFTSREYVINLDYWYAQSHPLEDFAETFAVWLQPGSRWRTVYRDWPAYRKLLFVDELMGEIAKAPQKVKTRRREGTLKTERMTLREYYRKRKSIYSIDAPSAYDLFLERVFQTEVPGLRGESAASFLRRWRAPLRRRLAAVTGHPPYAIDQVLNELIPRCRKLDLRVSTSDERTLIDVSILLTSLTTRYLSDRHPRFQR